MKKFMCRYPFDTKGYEMKILRPRGRFAHGKFPQSRYAKDFKLPFETPVLAVRKGVVFASKHDSDTHYSIAEVSNLTMSQIMELADEYTNRVYIDHKDGTFTEYAHLTRKEFVSAGQSVREGEVIGNVGITGITDVFHLHYNTFIIKNGNGVSIPVKFIK